LTLAVDLESAKEQQTQGQYAVVASKCKRGD
jgi:hypothetical protein